MTEVDISSFAKLLLGYDIEINDKGAIIFYKDGLKCVYSKKHFIEKYFPTLKAL